MSETLGDRLERGADSYVRTRARNFVYDKFANLYVRLDASLVQKTTHSGLRVTSRAELYAKSSRSLLDSARAMPPRPDMTQLLKIRRIFLKEPRGVCFGYRSGAFFAYADSIQEGTWYLSRQDSLIRFVVEGKQHLRAQSVMAKKKPRELVMRTAPARDFNTVRVTYDRRRKISYFELRVEHVRLATSFAWVPIQFSA